MLTMRRGQALNQPAADGRAPWKRASGEGEAVLGKKRCQVVTDHSVDRFKVINARTVIVAASII